MSTVYKDEKSKFYQAVIWIDGRKFSRSTKRTSQREAQAEADRLEIALRAEQKEQGEAKVSLRIDHVAGRYMNDIGDHHAGEGAEITRGKVDRLVKYFGPDKELTAITQADVLALRNWRRKHMVGKGKNAKPIGPFTVNDTTEQLKKLFTYVKNAGARLPSTAPKFNDKQLWLPEPRPRPRVLSEGESDRLDDAAESVRRDYEPLIQFARVTGKRKTECITLEQAHIKWERGVILLKGKGDKWLTITITPTIRAMLWPLREHHPKFVFTYVAQRTTTVKRKGGELVKLVKGKRYPLTKAGLRRVWTEMRVEAGIPITGDDRFRFHDIRHDFASNLLASVPSADGMKIVQEALGHASILTTMGTYAHVEVARVAAAIEAQAQARLQRRHKNHRSGHRSKLLKAV